MIIAKNTQTSFYSGKQKNPQAIDNMVLINPEKAFKYERDNHVQTMMKRGIHRIKDIKLNKMVPDEAPPVTVKNPIQALLMEDDSLTNKNEGEISLMNLTVKRFNQSFQTTQNK